MTRESFFLYINRLQQSGRLGPIEEESFDLQVNKNIKLERGNFPNKEADAADDEYEKW